MIGIDTNVLVRFLVQDDPQQARRATAVFARMTLEEPGYLTAIVLVETYWVLTRAYKLDPADVLAALTELLDSDGVEIQDRETVRGALRVAATGAQFPDALIAAQCAARGCREIVSFDRQPRPVSVSWRPEAGVLVTHP